MSDAIVSWFSNMNGYTAVFFMSMLPIVELRGSIIFAAATDLPFAPDFKLAKNHKTSFGCCKLGSGAFYEKGGQNCQIRNARTFHIRCNSASRNGCMDRCDYSVDTQYAHIARTASDIFRCAYGRVYNACRLLRTF